MKKIFRTIETFKKIAIERGGECLSKIYANSKTKLKFKCGDCNYIWNAVPETIKNGNAWCPKCGDVLSLTIDEMKNLAIQRGGECLSNTYINNSTDLLWRCKNGHEWYATPNRIKSAKRWCLECSGSKKKTIELMREIAKERNGECLSKIYEDAHSKLLWRCEKEHEWYASYHSIKNHNSWCPECTESNGEQHVKRYLKNNNIKYIKQKRFKDCKNKIPLPFDFYLPDLNVAIEFDGAQHYFAKDFFGGKDKFTKQKINDEIKTKYCLEKKIFLIRIPYFEKNINNFLEKNLKTIDFH